MSLYGIKDCGNGALNIILYSLIPLQKRKVSLFFLKWIVILAVTFMAKREKKEQHEIDVYFVKELCFLTG